MSVNAPDTSFYDRHVENFDGELSKISHEQSKGRSKITKAQLESRSPDNTSRRAGDLTKLQEMRIRQVPVL